MGMDVYGHKPTTEEGEYFRNNCWSWGPLAAYIETFVPDIAAKCRYWHYNEGDGLDAADAIELAERLQAEIDSGRYEQFARTFTSSQEAAPDVVCELCEGTGKRKSFGADDPVTGVPVGRFKCNACDGQGHVRPWSTHCSFDVENVRAFIAFLRGCGGFAIW
jgi:hypothetical protein